MAEIIAIPEEVPQSMQKYRAALCCAIIGALASIINVYLQFVLNQFFLQGSPLFIRYFADGYDDLYACLLYFACGLASFCAFFFRTYTVQMPVIECSGSNIHFLLRLFCTLLVCPLAFWFQSLGAYRNVGPKLHCSNNHPSRLLERNVRANATHSQENAKHKRRKGTITDVSLARLANAFIIIIHIADCMV
jgi:hypothetical protein